MASPIRCLDEDIISSLLRIAPEREQELLNFRDKYDPEVLFFDKKGFSFSVNTEQNQIKLPTQSLEFLWCASYVFYLIYKKYTDCQQANVSDQFDLHGDVELRSGMELYRWSITNLSSSSSCEWPDETACPAKSNSQATECELIADELFLSAIAWILHHEIAHIYNKHPNEPTTYEESREQEREADKSATTWILGDEDCPKRLKKRGVGIAVAALVITTQDLLSGEFKETTHPKSFERLFSVLDGSFDDDHLVYEFSVIILQTHMTLAGHNIDLSENIPWKDLFTNCLIQLSRT